MLDTNTEVEEEAKLQADDEDINPSDATTFVPVVARKLSENDTIRKTVKERGRGGSAQVLPWPKSRDEPINEFSTEGYISCAFPTLFSTGAGDFVAPRHHAVTAGCYFKHLLMYSDGQFAKHPRFRYFALNTVMRWRPLQAGRVYIWTN